MNLRSTRSRLSHWLQNRHYSHLLSRTRRIVTTIMTTLTTLSTGLHKSDEFIKGNANNMYTRIVAFSNGKKVCLNEETAIPRAENVEGTIRYLRCNSITYPSDYDICHHDLIMRTNFSMWCTNSSQSSTTIPSRDVNAHGLVLAVSRAIMPLNIYITTDVQGSQYNGIRFSWDHMRTYKIDMTYLMAWMFGIIPTYENGKEKEFCTIYDNTSTPIVDLLDYEVSTSTIKRVLFPLLNGEIHRMTISCEELTTSQYINGHKTATIAKTTLMPSQQVKFPNVPNWQQDIIHYFLMPHPQSPQGTAFPDICTSSPSDLTYFPNVAPACIPYLRCNINQYSNVIDPIAVNMESSIAVSRVTNFSAHGDRIGEIRINLKMLNEVSFKWMVEIYLGNSYSGNKCNIDSHQKPQG